MKRDRTPRHWHSAAQYIAQYVLGAIGLASVTFVGSFVASLVFSIAAALCLNYFFTPPIFSRKRPSAHTTLTT
jgi:peptidoglycan/LPS O-acetylase OafA/YrhL